MKKKFKMGKVYEVGWLDHDEVDSKNPEQAAHTAYTIINTYGVYVGHNKKQHIFAFNTEKDNIASENNDNMRILKDKIVSYRELK